jgi:hypothetical protein
MDEDRHEQRFLDRPVRSLLDLKIGTVLRAYVLYLALGLVVGLIGLIVLLATWDRESGNALGRPGSISWAEGAGKTVTPAQYRAIGSDARLDAVRRRFGEPATTGPNPFDLVSGDTQTCLGYRSSASDALFLFCFEAGKLIDKQTV